METTCAYVLLIDARKDVNDGARAKTEELDVSLVNTSTLLNGT